MENIEVVITGGSSGIGAAFARYFAMMGKQVLITGRRTEKLADVCNIINKEAPTGSCTYIANDLSLSHDRQKLTNILRNTNTLIALVNNAGYNVDGRFHEVDLADYQALAAVHINAIVDLSHSALPALIQNKGMLINIGSVAAFMPTPLAPLYGPSKAFIHTFTQSLAANYHQEGVHCLSLCPGFVRTDFHQKLGLSPDRFYKDHGLTKAYSADFVVQKAMADLYKGKSLSVPGWNYRLIVTLLGLIPDSWLTYFARRTKSARANQP